ncbi:ABC transporter permease [Pseudarthrobacter sp. 1G09]|uniref:ABC transporter permease n=1 Tax=Pseudarthrobacter sp. 1G09 TaxID=3416178 RepID=UPI003CEFAB74
MNKHEVFIKKSVRLTLSKLRPLAVLMVLGIATFVFADSVVGAGISSYSNNITTNSALNYVEVSSVGPGSAKDITDESLSQFEEIPHVAGSSGWAQFDLALQDPATWPTSNNPGAFTATPFISGVTPKVLEGEVPETGPKDGEVLLPDTGQGQKFAQLLGKEINFVYTKVIGPGNGEPAAIALRVVGIYDNSSPGTDGTQAAYVSDSVLKSTLSASRMAGEELTYPRAFVRVDTAEEVVSVQNAVRELGYSVNSVAGQIRSLTGLFALLALASWVIGGVLVIFCLGVGISVGGSWIKQRAREVGLLKAVGWSGKTIGGAYITELGLVGLAIGAGGALLGSLLSIFGTTVFSSLQLELLPVTPWAAPNWLLVVGALVCVPAFLCLGAMGHIARLARLDADSSLRDL